MATPPVLEFGIHATVHILAALQNHHQKQLAVPPFILSSLIGLLIIILAVLFGTSTITADTRLLERLNPRFSVFRVLHDSRNRANV